MAYGTSRLDCRHCEERSDEAIQSCGVHAMDCFASLAMTISLFSRQAADMLDDPGEIHPAIPRGIERLVDFLRMLAKRRCRPGGLRRILREREVLDHQDRRETR